MPRCGQRQDRLIWPTALLVLPPQVLDSTWTPRPASNGRRGGESYLLVLPFVPEKHSIVPRTHSEGWDRPVTHPQALGCGISGISNLSGGSGGRWALPLRTRRVREGRVHTTSWEEMQLHTAHSLGTGSTHPDVRSSVACERRPCRNELECQSFL